MRAQFVIPVLASILILGTLGLTQDVFANEHKEKTLSTECDSKRNDLLGLLCELLLPIQELLENLESTLASLEAKIQQNMEAIMSITDQSCNPGDVVTGFDVNGNVLCAPDQLGIGGAALSCENQQAIANVVPGFDIDDTCDPDLDNDNDGFVNDVDCDDNNPAVNAEMTYYRDADSDGHGDPNDSQFSCGIPDGYVSNADDCDDSQPTVYLGATEILDDLLDNNCNGLVDENSTLEFTVNPSVAYNGISTTITITGTDFDSLATVTILPGGVIADGVELSATVISSTEISAIVPFSLATGSYNVVVENDDGTFGNLEGALLITDLLTIAVESVNPSIISKDVLWNVFVRAPIFDAIPAGFVDFSDPTQVILVLQGDPNHNGLYMPTTFLDLDLLDAEVTLSTLGIYDLIVFDAAGNVGFLPNAISVQEPTTPSSGDLVITEAMVDPNAVSDVNGEWFEIVNVVNDVLSLNNLVISDLGTDSHTVASVESILIVPGQSFVFARNADFGTNGGVIVDYQYSSFTLGNTGDEIILSLGGVEIDQVVYDNSWPYGVGIAMQLDSSNFTSTENDLLFNWCQSFNMLFSGDLGTPGAPNHSCTVGSPF